MIDLTTDQLMTIQKSLIYEMRKKLKEPMCDYELISKLALLTDKIDSHRRKQWNDEKFGPYEEMADDMLEELERRAAIDDEDEEEQHFASDDIPF